VPFHLSFLSSICSRASPANATLTFVLERRHVLGIWFCVLSRGERPSRASDRTAREAIRQALAQARFDETKVAGWG
jgi:hypothetical protein